MCWAGSWASGSHVPALFLGPFQALLGHSPRAQCSQCPLELCGLVWFSQCWVTVSENIMDQTLSPQEVPGSGCSSVC